MRYAPAAPRPERGLSALVWRVRHGIRRGLRSSSDRRRATSKVVAMGSQYFDVEPSTPLETGLSKTIAYFEEVLRRHSRHGAAA